MRATINLYSLFILLLATFSAAWPWPEWLPDRDALMVRQDNNNNPPPASNAPRPTAAPAPTENRNPSNTDSNASGTDRPAATGTDQPNPSATDSRGPITDGPQPTDASTTASTEKSSYGNENPAGGVVLVTPAVLQGSQFYKIGDKVTFAWNYTNLLATPTAVNVYATNALAKNYYTMTANMTVGGNATNAVIWDTANYTSSPSGVTDPLLTAQYTLIIFDAESSVSATAQPGYLAVYNQYQFGMYLKQPYTDLADGYKCATCSGAMGDMERRFLSFVFGMGLLTVLSFTWFVTGTGVIW
ncbi:hypothetical protein HYFRA_00005162 [Hymenoscyphus fraxineus]|uniref:DUF7137 domain-containing protein n=1 Tax=Hymenoscyphus fraxineus TaxID=746836 RepID=A0A9N9PPM1_9HELO|nr:hypothetical protein HYFRA_00005162 [Hymenoscyphus fraxineus]